MKFKSIASICKSKKTITVYDQPSKSGCRAEQWIGDGFAAYTTAGLPYLEEENIYAIFDISEKQRSKFIYNGRSLPKRICFDDHQDGEKLIEASNISIIHAGCVIKAFQTSKGIIFVDSQYLAPLSDRLSTLEFYQRETPDGLLYIVAKLGLIIQSIIMPFDCINEKFLDNLTDFAAGCRTSLSNKESISQAEGTSLFERYFGQCTIEEEGDEENDN